MTGMPIADVWTAGNSTISPAKQGGDKHASVEREFTVIVRYIHWSLITVHAFRYTWKQKPPKMSCSSADRLYRVFRKK